MKVIVAFDPQYGSRERVDVGDAFWLVESPENRALATKIWTSGNTDANSAVFKSGPMSDTDVLSLFEDVDLHHPGWTDVVFHGVPLTKHLRGRFKDWGFATSEIDQGFAVGRRTPRGPAATLCRRL